MHQAQCAIKCFITGGQCPTLAKKPEQVSTGRCVGGMKEDHLAVSPTLIGKVLGDKVKTKANSHAAGPNSGLFSSAPAK